MTWDNGVTPQFSAHKYLSKTSENMPRVKFETGGLDVTIRSTQLRLTDTTP